MVDPCAKLCNYRCIITILNYIVDNMNIIILLDHPWIIMKYIHLAVVLLGLNPIFFGDTEVINHLPREVLSRYQV